MCPGVGPNLGPKLRMRLGGGRLSFGRGFGRECVVRNHKSGKSLKEVVIRHGTP